MSLSVGDDAPDLTLTDDRGRAWSATEHRGSPVVVILHRHFY